MNMSSWTKEKTMLLIEKIRQSNVWDVKSKQYKDTKVRGDIFTEIGQSLNFSRKETEDKWHNIKSQSRELAKVKSSKKSGVGTEDVYVPNWYAFKSLLFLKEHYEPVINISTDGEQNSALMQSKVNQVEAFSEERENLDNDKEAETNANAESTLASGVSSAVSAAISKTTTKTGWKRKREDTDLKEAVNCMKVVGNDIIKKSSDNFDIFGDHVANELRCLKDPKYRLILAQTKQTIYNALSHAEMSRIELDSGLIRPATGSSMYSEDQVSETTTDTLILQPRDAYTSNDSSLVNFLSNYSEHDQ